MTGPGRAIIIPEWPLSFNLTNAWPGGRYTGIIKSRSWVHHQGLGWTDGGY